MGGTAYEVVLQAGLPSAEGPLGLAEETVVPFETYGPLRLERVTQHRSEQAFDPARGITLHFTTPVRFEELRQALSFDPDVQTPPPASRRATRR